MIWVKTLNIHLFFRPTMCLLYFFPQPSLKNFNNCFFTYRETLGKCGSIPHFLYPDLLPITMSETAEYKNIVF